jgi:hypothetical protein
MRLEMHGFKTKNQPRKLSWWRRLRDFPNPTLDALLTLFGMTAIVVTIYLFRHWRFKEARRAISFGPIEMQNDQNRRPGFLESAMEHPTLVVVAIIAVVFVSMVLHLLWTRQDREEQAAIVYCVATCWWVKCAACYRTLHVRQSNSGAGCAFRGDWAMNDPQVGWIAAIIIGGVAGWLADQFMKSDMGLLMNIVSVSSGRRLPAPFWASLGFT